ncbi:MAG: hypothetical protein R3B47_01910 [Bacteroidia bacterium]
MKNSYLARRKKNQAQVQTQCQVQSNPLFELEIEFELAPDTLKKP